MKPEEGTMPETKGKRSRKASSTGWILASLAVSALAALAKRDQPYLVAFGEISMIASISLFALAWAGYLKKDKVRLFPRKADTVLGEAPTWKDRIPEAGSPPLPAAPWPDPSGPGGEAYQRLLEAESRLREKIQNADESRESGAPSAPWIRSSLWSAGLLLLLSVFLQYILPLFVWI
ncbi:MAG TPA: hypothetical protein VIO60_06845 [Rectinemataceae bacterium]